MAGINRRISWPLSHKERQGGQDREIKREIKRKRRILLPVLVLSVHCIINFLVNLRWNYLPKNKKELPLTSNHFIGSHCVDPTVTLNRDFLCFARILVLSECQGRRTGARYG
jgi:hypothetical protein